MDKVLLLLMALTPFISFSQSKTKTAIFGFVNETTSVSNTSFGSKSTYIESGTMVVVSNYLQNSNRYETYFNGEKYFIGKEYLRFAEDYDPFLLGLSTEEVDSLSMYAQEASEIIFKGEVDKAFEFLKKTKALGLAITDWSYYDESEYTDGTSVKIEVYNPTAKSIKYLWFSFLAYNPVGDKVLTKGVSIRTVKGVGPIKPGNTGSYEYEYVWFTDLVETVKIYSIKVQYMDGTYKTITNPKSIVMPSSLYSTLKIASEGLTTLE